MAGQADETSDERLVRAYRTLNRVARCIKRALTVLELRSADPAPPQTSVAQERLKAVQKLVQLATKELHRAQEHIQNEDKNLEDTQPLSVLVPFRRRDEDES